MKKRPVPTKESARTGVVHSIAFMSDLQVTQDGEYVKVANTLDANLRALDTAIQSGGQQTDYSLTIQAPASPDASYAAQYEFRQCGDVLATINIPKDMVVQEGSVVDITFSEDHLYDGQTDVTEKIKGAGVTPTEADAGKYVKLVIANKTDSTLYIKATDLVDAYTAQQGATQVQLAISNANVISATIVAGSVGTTELSPGVNASLAKADTALQASDVVSTYDAESTAPVNGVAVAAAIAAVDVSGKADKDTDAVEGNLAMFDANGNPVDSGKAASDFAEADHTHDSLVNGDSSLNLSQAGVATVTVAGAGPATTATASITFTSGTLSGVDPMNGGAQFSYEIEAQTIEVPLTLTSGAAPWWEGQSEANVGELMIVMSRPTDGESIGTVWIGKKPSTPRQGGFPLDACAEYALPATGDNLTLQMGGASQSMHTFTGTVTYSQVAGPSASVTKTLATTDDVSTAVANAVNALDAEVTSSDGTNVQVKVTETNGKVTAVNITTDNTYAKPADGIPGSDIADGAITAAKLAKINGMTFVDEATSGDYVGKEYRLYILNGRLMIEEAENVPSGLPTWDKDTTLPQMKSYWKFDVTANANDEDPSTDRTNTALIGIDSLDNAHVLGIVNNTPDENQILWVTTGFATELLVIVKDSDTTLESHWSFDEENDSWVNDNDDADSTYPGAIPKWTELTSSEAAELYPARTCSYYKIEVTYGDSDSITEGVLVRVDNSNADITVLKQIPAPGASEAHITIVPQGDRCFTVCNNNYEVMGEEYDVEGTYYFEPITNSNTGDDGITWSSGDCAPTTWPHFTFLTPAQATALYTAS